MATSIDVLHVEDDSDFADLTQTYLDQQASDFHVKTVSSAEEGLERIDATGVDCIVSDYDMPGANGIEFLASVRQDHPDLPFILFTGKGSEEVASGAISQGVTDYLQKGSDPSQFTVLANRITNAVEQYRSKHALEVSQERLSLFFDQSPLGVIEWKDDFTVARVNAAAEEKLGYEEDELVGDSWERLVPQSDRSDVDEVVGQLLDDRGGYHHVNENLTKQGEHIVCEWHNRVVTDGSGEVVAVFSQFQDITERRSYERELERTNAMLSTLFDALPVGVLAEDADRRVHAVNQRLFDLLGFSGHPHDVIGRDCAALLEEERRVFERPDAVLARIEEIVEMGDWSGSEEVRLADGRILIRRHDPIELPDGDGRLWVYRDTTDRTEYERTIKALHGVATDLASCESPDEIYAETIDAAASLLEFDRAALAIEKDGRLHVRAMSDEVPLEERPTMASNEGIAGKSFQTGEAILVRDATEHPEAVPQSERIHSVISVPIGPRGVFQVIDDEPEAFEEQDVELARLLTRHTESALDLVDRKRELHRQNERLESFANVVSHDLRNPLNVAEGRLELVRSDHDNRHLDGIARAHERMHELIEDVLTLAHSGSPVTDLETFALAPVVQECWRNVTTEGATLRADVQLEMRADRSRLKRLIENVIRNAVEHGGSDVMVRIGELESGDGFFVEDDGPGIPEEERDEIFTSGYSTTSGGTGFGLAIVEHIVDAHAWEIRMTEGAGGGARFEVSGVDVRG